MGLLFPEIATGLDDKAFLVVKNGSGADVLNGHVMALNYGLSAEGDPLTPNAYTIVDPTDTTACFVAGIVENQGEDGYGGIKDGDWGLVQCWGSNDKCRGQYNGGGNSINHNIDPTTDLLIAVRGPNGSGSLTLTEEKYLTYVLAANGGAIAWDRNALIGMPLRYHSSSLGTGAASTYCYIMRLGH